MMRKKILFIVFSLLISVVYAKWEHKNISQAVFAKAVEDRTPTSVVNELDNSVKKIYFFTNLRNLDGEKITHRWLYNGKNMAEVGFAPQGPRWRVYSSKNLLRSWLGTWTVEVVNEQGEVLLSKSFNYIKTAL